MASEYATLCSTIMRQSFGPTVQKVVDCFFVESPRTLASIVATTNLPRNEATAAVAVLIRFNLVIYETTNLSDAVPVYTLKREEVLYVMRYTRYVEQIEEKYGKVAATIMMHLLEHGAQPASQVLVGCLAAANRRSLIEEYRRAFLRLIGDYYLKRVPQGPNGNASDSDDENMVDDGDGRKTSKQFTPPPIDLITISKLQAGLIKPEQTRDSEIFWQVNKWRLEQERRDDILIGALEHRIDHNAGRCFKAMLQLLYNRTDPSSKAYCNSFTVAEVEQLMQETSNGANAIKNMKETFDKIASDSLCLVHEVNAVGSGDYMISFDNAFNHLAIECVQNMIAMRFGHHAGRIFRLVHSRRYIDERDLQREMRIPSRDCKILTYKLMQSRYIHVKSIRRPVGEKLLTPCMYLYYTRQSQLVKMLLNLSYTNLVSSIMITPPKEDITFENTVDKSRRIVNIFAALGTQGATDQHITEILSDLMPPERLKLRTVKARLRPMTNGDLFVDDTIFLLQMHNFYRRQAAE